MKVLLVQLIVLMALQFSFVQLQQPVECGLQKVDANRKDLIRQGQDARPGQFPWHAAVYQWKGRSYEYVCGGSILSRTFVITAGHCVRDLYKQKLQPRLILVVLGLHDRQDARSSQQLGATQLHFYEETSATKRKNDIALIELSSGIRYTNYIQPVCINTEQDLTGQTGDVPGWGATESSASSTGLRFTQLPVLNTNVCLEDDRDFGSTLDSSLFCAGHLQGTGVCSGDSGGGLVFNRDRRWYLGGVVSNGAPDKQNSASKCRTDGYVAFTNVQHFLAWIKAITDLRPEQDARRAYSKLPRDCGSTRGFENPWIALLRYTVGGDSIQYDLCTGSLINERYVLTAGFCVDPPAVHGMALKEVHLGVRNRKSATEATEVFGVHSIVAHPSFSHSSWYRNNIGLIRLNRKVIFKNHIRPICLPAAPELQSWMHGQYTGAGWKLTRAGDSDTLLSQTLAFSGNGVCNNRLAQADLAHRIDDTQMCVDGVREDSIYGDRGSPLGGSVNYDGGRRFVQFGVQAGYYANQEIYTRVASYMRWILDNVSE